MLSIFRSRGLTSFVYGFIILATVAVFVIQFRPNAGQKAATLRQTCVTNVRGWCVEPKDYDAVKRVLMPRDPQTGEPSRARAKQMQLNRIVVDALVERELLVGEADRLGLRVSDDEVTESIYDGLIYLSPPSDRTDLAGQFPVTNGRVMPQLYGAFKDPKTKRFDTKQYERTIRAFMGLSPTEFREEQGREILAAKVRDLVRAPIRVSDTEALEAYQQEKGNATIAHVSVKRTYAARWLLSNAQTDIDAWARDKANADLIETTIAGLKDEDKPKAGHIRHILVKVEKTATEGDKTAAVNKLAEAVRRIKTGERFPDVASDVSQDYGSARQGGDVGDKTDAFAAPFKKAADALKPGETTPAAIETQFGYHIVTKDDPDPAVLKREVTRSLYVKAKAEDAARDLATRILASIKGGKSAEEATLAALAPVIKGARAMPPLEVVPEPEPIEADAGTDGGASTRPVVIVGRAINADDDADKPRVETTSAFNRGGDPIRGVNGEEQNKLVAFAFTHKEEDVLPEPVRGEGGYHVVQLKTQKAATREEFDKDRETYVQTLLAEKQAEALATYVKRLREKAKGEIKVDEQFLSEQPKDGGAPSPQDEEQE